MKNKTAKLHVWAFGLALGIIWGLGMFVTGLVGMGTMEWGRAFIDGMGSVYIGFGPTFLGSVIGALWGFVDFFIFGVIVAWLYNCFSGHCGKKGSESGS